MNGGNGETASGTWSFFTRTVPNVTSFVSTVANRWLQQQDEAAEEQRDEALQRDIRNEMARISELLREQEQGAGRTDRSFDVEVKHQLGRVQNLLKKTAERKARLEQSPSSANAASPSQPRRPGLNVTVDSPNHFSTASASVPYSAPTHPSLPPASHDPPPSAERFLRDSPLQPRHPPPTQSRDRNAVRSGAGLGRRPSGGSSVDGSSVGGSSIAGGDELRTLFSRARHNRYKEVEEILDSGVSCNLRDGHGNTLLMVAAQNGNKRIAKMCLRRGADLNAQNYRGQTALHYCYAFRYHELAQYLEEKGASHTIRNEFGLECREGLEPKEERVQMGGGHRDSPQAARSPEPRAVEQTSGRGEDPEERKRRKERRRQKRASREVEAVSRGGGVPDWDSASTTSAFSTDTSALTREASPTRPMNGTSAPTSRERAERAEKKRDGSNRANGTEGRPRADDKSVDEAGRLSDAQQEGASAREGAQLPVFGHDEDGEGEGAVAVEPAQSARAEASVGEGGRREGWRRDSMPVMALSFQERRTSTEERETSLLAGEGGEGGSVDRQLSDPKPLGRVNSVDGPRRALWRRGSAGATEGMRAGLPPSGGSGKPRGGSATPFGASGKRFAPTPPPTPPPAHVIAAHQPHRTHPSPATATAPLLSPSQPPTHTQAQPQPSPPRTGTRTLPLPPPPPSDEPHSAPADSSTSPPLLRLSHPPHPPPPTALPPRSGSLSPPGRHCSPATAPHHASAAAAAAACRPVSLSPTRLWEGGAAARQEAPEVHAGADQGWRARGRAGTGDDKDEGAKGGGRRRSHSAEHAQEGRGAENEAGAETARLRRRSLSAETEVAGRGRDALSNRQEPGGRVREAWGQPEGSASDNARRVEGGVGAQDVVQGGESRGGALCGGEVGMGNAQSATEGVDKAGGQDEIKTGEERWAVGVEPADGGEGGEAEASNSNTLVLARGKFHDSEEAREERGDGGGGEGRVVEGDLEISELEEMLSVLASQERELDGLHLELHQAIADTAPGADGHVEGHVGTASDHGPAANADDLLSELDTRELKREDVPGQLQRTVAAAPGRRLVTENAEDLKKVRSHAANGEAEARRAEGRKGLAYNPNDISDDSEDEDDDD